MERRGARSVTALELGPDDEWDIVPIGGVADRSAADGKRRSIAGTLRALEYTKEQLGSKVEVVRGTVYDAPKVVGPVNIALMGNILQHLRDPFLAIERVASLVTERIIIAETLWVDEDWFLKSASLRLIPRKETPDVDHSWYQVSPPWVGEILKLLGFTDLRCEYHDQQFNGNWIDNRPRKVRHFTYTARR